MSLPVSFVASTVYRAVLVKMAARVPGISPVLTIASCLVLGLLVAETFGLIWLGALRCRQLIGPAYEVGTVPVLILGAPALVNLLVLRTWGQTLPWPVVGFLGALLAMGSFAMRLNVVETLYGVDGVGGPYSSGGLSRQSVPE